MTWRYMNPGLVSLLDSNYAAIQYTGYEYSRTGYAFSVDNQSNKVTLPVPAINQGDEFWAKLDFFCTEETLSFSLRAPYTFDGRFNLWFYDNDSATCSFIYDTNIWTYTSQTLFSESNSFLGIQRNDVNSFAVHIVYGDADTAKAEIMFSDGKKYTGTGYAIPFYVSYQYIQIESGASGKFSNIICSDEEVTAAERLAVSLPAGATATDMATMAGGMYIANGIEQTFLQTPDVSSIISAHGANSTVTGIQIRGNPAYRTGTGLANMIGLSKSGNTITEHGTCAVGTTPTNFISDGWGLSGVTLSDLQNMQFGWKAAR